MKKKGGKKGGGEASQEKEEDGAELKTMEKRRGGNISDEKKREGEGKDEAKPTGGGFARQARNLKNAVIAEEDGFSLDNPKGKRDEREKEGVVRE